MTYEEILAQQAEQKKAQLLRAKQQNDADLLKQQDTLSQDATKDRTNAQYQGALGEGQGAIIDKFIGFGANDTGAGIQRQNTRINANASVLSNLDSAYAKAKGDLAEVGTKVNTDYNNNVVDVEAEYKNAVSQYQFQEAEKKRADYLKGQQEEQNKQIQAEKDRQDSLYSDVSKALNSKSTKQIDTDKNGQPIYADLTPQGKEDILKKAKEKYNMSDENIQRLRMQMGIFDEPASGNLANVQKKIGMSVIWNDGLKKQITYTNDAKAADLAKEVSRGYISKLDASMLINEQVGNGTMSEDEAVALIKKYKL
jgi:hypothetical protein